MSFHIFHINEVYSNIDSTIQFIEFAGDANGENLWAGHTITSTDGVNTNTFAITANLPSNLTNGKSVLVATQGFADLGIVTPDYIIPNGFLFINNGTVNFPGMIGGTISYIALPVDGISSLSRDGSTGINSPTNFSGNSGTVTASGGIAGSNDPDNLSGTGGDDIIFAAGGDDTVTGAAGNDQLNGGSGVDSAIFNGNRESFTLSATDTGFSVSGPDGSDTLSDIERVIFSDSNVAIDMSTGQAANNTVRIIGAAFDTPIIEQHPDYVGIGLDLFDSGQTMLEVSQLAVGVMGNLGNDVFVDTVYQNVIGVAPTKEDRDHFTALLQGSGGSMTQAQLLELAANSEANALNINLVGLQQSGVEYI